MPSNTVYIEIDMPKILFYPNEEKRIYDTDMDLYYSDCENIDSKRENFCRKWIKNNMPKYIFLKLENTYSECDGLAFSALLIK